METTPKKQRVQSTVAKAAKRIREDLKKLFPKIKFSVTSDNYSMGDRINVNYSDAVPTKEVEKHIGKYQYGHFDGMTDMYVNSNDLSEVDADGNIVPMPQTKYLFVERKISPSIKEDLIKVLNEVRSYKEGWEGERDRNMDIWRISGILDLTDYKGIVYERPADQVCYDFEKCFKVIKNSDDNNNTTEPGRN